MSSRKPHGNVGQDGGITESVADAARCYLYLRTDVRMMLETRKVLHVNNVEEKNPLAGGGVCNAGLRSYLPPIAPLSPVDLPQATLVL